MNVDNDLIPLIPIFQYQEEDFCFLGGRSFGGFWFSFLDMGLILARAWGRSLTGMEHQICRIFLNEDTDPFASLGFAARYM